MKAIELLESILTACEVAQTTNGRGWWSQYISEIPQAIAELAKPEIQLEASRKFSKEHKDRELANAKKRNEYYDQIKQLRTELEKQKKHQAMHDDYGNPCTHTEPCNCHCDFADCPYFTEYKRLKEALKKYGHHSRLCKVMEINRNLKCDCGFEQALKDEKNHNT